MLSGSGIGGNFGAGINGGSFSADIGSTFGLGGGFGNFGPGGLGGLLGVPTNVDFNVNVGDASNLGLLNMVAAFVNRNLTDQGLDTSNLSAEDQGLLESIRAEAERQFSKEQQTVPVQGVDFPEYGAVSTEPIIINVPVEEEGGDSGGGSPVSDAPLNTLFDELSQGVYVYGDAGRELKEGAITQEQFDRFVDRFNEYTGTLPGQRPYAVGDVVSGAYTPPAPYGTIPENFDQAGKEFTEADWEWFKTHGGADSNNNGRIDPDEYAAYKEKEAQTAAAATETTSSATVGTTTPPGSRTYAGIPQEILDRIDVGVEIPIPGPGNQMLPVIFGSVGEFIDWVKSVGVDPTTGNPDDFMGTIGRAVGDVFTTAKDSITGAIKGATTGAVQDIDQFIRDMILAGTFDPGAIFNAAKDKFPDVFGGTSSTTAPPTGPTGPTGPDFGLPGNEEDKTKEDPETASDVVSTVDTTLPGYQDEPDFPEVIETVTNRIDKDNDDVVDTVSNDLLDYQDEPDFPEEITKTPDDEDEPPPPPLEDDNEDEPTPPPLEDDDEDEPTPPPPEDDDKDEPPPPPPEDDDEDEPPFINEDLRDDSTPQPPSSSQDLGMMAAAAAGAAFEPKWTELFKYTTLTPYQKKALAPYVDYIAQARQMRARGMLS